MAVLDLEVRSGIAEEVDSQVKEWVDGWASGNLRDSAGCDWKTDVGHFDLTAVWDVKSYPRIDIVADVMGHAEVETVKPGKVSIESEEATAVIVPPAGEVTTEYGVDWGPN